MGAHHSHLEIDMLGEKFSHHGTFGEIHVQKVDGFQKDVAVKIARDPFHHKELERELQVLQENEHAHIVKGYTSCVLNGWHRGGYVMEFMGGGDLQHVFRTEIYDLHKALRWMDQVLDALEFLHGKHVVHGDLRPAKILLSESREVAKISDFGLHRAIDIDQTHDLELFIYSAPERLSGDSSCAKSDSYSVAVILWQLCARHLPFTEYACVSTFLHGVLEDRATLRSLPKLTQEANSLLHSSLDRNPHHRPHVNVLRRSLNLFEAAS